MHIKFYYLVHSYDYENQSAIKTSHFWAKGESSHLDPLLSVTIVFLKA